MATATKAKRKADAETLTAERQAEVIGRLYQHLRQIEQWQPLLDCDDEWAAAALLRERLKDRFNRPACGLALGTVAGEHGIRVTLRQAVPGSNRGEDIELGQIEWQDVATELLSLAATEKDEGGRMKDEGGPLPPGATSTVTPAGIEQHDPDVVRPSLAKAAAAAKGKSATLPPREIDTRQILLGSIKPSPFQTRRDFDPGKLQQLADSIQQHGLLQPVVVRLIDAAVGDACELIAGERRWRAAKLAGLKVIDAKIIDCDDDQAAELVMIENLQRDDLNPIEEAEGFVMLLSRGGGTQADLAAKIGRSQPYIANALRLLDLPEPWRGRVISREMSPSHAKLLAPHVGREKLLAKLDKTWKEGGGSPALKRFEQDLEHAIVEASVPLSRYIHTSGTGQFKSTTVRIGPNDQTVDLDVIEVKRWNGKEKRAFNTTDANRVLTEKANAWRTKQGIGKGKGGKADKPSAAAAKAQAETDARNRQRELREWLDSWRSRLVADAIAGGISEGEWSMLLLWMVTLGAYSETTELLRDKTEAMVGRGSIWKAKQPGEVLLKAVVAVFRDCGPRNSDNSPPAEAEEFDALCSLLSIDPAKVWLDRPAGKQVFAGELTELLWDFFDEDQLREMCAAWKIASDVSDRTHREIVQIIHAQAKPLALPAEIAELLPGRKKPTTKKAKATKGKR